MNALANLATQIETFRKEHGPKAALPIELARATLKMYEVEKDKGMTPDAFCEKVGISKTSLYRWMAGVFRKSPKKAHAPQAAVAHKTVQHKQPRGPKKKRPKKAASMRKAPEKVLRRFDEAAAPVPKAGTPVYMKTRNTVEELLGKTAMLATDSPEIAEEMNAATSALRAALHKVIDLQYGTARPITHIGTRRLDESQREQLGTVATG